MRMSVILGMWYLYALRRFWNTSAISLLHLKCPKLQRCLCFLWGGYQSSKNISHYKHREEREEEEGRRERAEGEEVYTFQTNPDMIYPLVTRQETTTLSWSTHTYSYAELDSTDYLWAGDLALFVKGLCERILVLKSAHMHLCKLWIFVG